VSETRVHKQIKGTAPMYGRHSWRAYALSVSCSPPGVRVAWQAHKPSTANN